MKNIFIVGSGTIGKALAVFLKLAGRNVVLIRGSINEDGTIQTRGRLSYWDHKGR